MSVSLSPQVIARRGVASVTVKEALVPILQEEEEKLLHKLDVCPPILDQLLDIRADLRAIRRIRQQIDTAITAYDSLGSAEG